MKKKTKIFALLSALFIAFAIPGKVMAQDPNSPPPPQQNQQAPPPQQDPNAPPPQQDPNTPPPPQDEPNGDYQEFYSQLSPYGQWVDEPTYGYVFIPTTGPGFYPYRSRG